MDDGTIDTRDPSQRIADRLHQHYLRWLATQPVEGTCRSEGWRAFWRSYRRSVNSICQSTAGWTVLIVIAACGAVMLLGLVIAVAGAIVWFAPRVFFAHPEQRPFADGAQQAAAALTRLTVFQTLLIPIFLLLVTVPSRRSKDGIHRAFHKGRDAIPRRARQIGVAVLVATSASVTMGATFGQPGGFGAAIMALLVVVCLGWLVLGIANRLMIVRVPGIFSDPAIRVAVIFMPVLLLVLPLTRLMYNSTILRIAPHLDWLGPMGFINGSLYRFGQGQFDRLLPVGLCCAVAALVGQRFLRKSASWSFRRRLLALYRTEPLVCAKRPVPAASNQSIAADIRTLLAERRARPWTIVVPYRLRRNAAYPALLLMILLPLQLIFFAVTKLIAHFDQLGYFAQGDPITEDPLTSVLTASVGAWSVFSVEAYANLVRHNPKLFAFARRPVSPGTLWLDLQREGRVFLPVQILLALPLLVLPALLSPDLFRLGVTSIGVALVAVVGIRTLACVAICYGAAVCTLREWIAGLLALFGVIGGMLVFVGFMGVGTTFGFLVSQLLLTPIALLLFLVAWGMWRAVGQPRPMLQNCW